MKVGTTELERNHQKERNYSIRPLTEEKKTLIIINEIKNGGRRVKKDHAK